MMLTADSIQLEYGGRKILQDVYLNCKPGEVVGLLGRNGSGKSSLLKIIFGSIIPYYKYVSINGVNVDKGFLDNKIAYLPQFNYLPKNILIKNAAAALVDPLHWDIFAATEIYQSFCNNTAARLSGGELRKLETLLIIFSKARYILLDEPFTHISPIQADEIKLFIKKMSAAKGFIITDHQYLNILEIATRIILIENGRTKHINSQEELITYGYLSGN